MSKIYTEVAWLLRWHVLDGSNKQPVNHNSRINFVFLQITLSIFLLNSQIKTFVLLEFLSSGKPWSFYLQFKLDELLKYLTPKGVKL